MLLANNASRSFAVPGAVRRRGCEADDHAEAVSGGDQISMFGHGQMQSISPLHSAASLCAHRRRAGEHDFAATLLAIAGHDLRQPLQIITSAHDVLAATHDSREQREHLARAENATWLIATMLDQLVEALELQEFAPVCSTEAVALNPLLEALDREFAGPARSKGVSLRIARSRAVVWSQPVLLLSMLRNLMRNAIDYTPRGGRVDLVCRRTGSALRISVRDNGVGISREALTDIFKAFRRGDKIRTDGLGLGLYIVKCAANLLNHRIDVHSVPGSGSRFAIVVEAADLPTSVVAIRARPHRNTRPAESASDRITTFSAKRSMFP
jgi:two-component system, OmpR family, phosphate regulon sensor histidine kinase PhoR